jgi:hypothetical protein
VWYSLAAYFLAIAAKVAFQLAVPPPSNPYLEGAYYGLQTSVLEVGLAYGFARVAFARHRMGVEQAPAYGAALAFWENGVLLGLLALPGLAITIATGGSGLPSDSVGQVVGLVALGTLERVSSILAHFSWGILVVVAAATGQRRFLVAALPMGLIDFLVPFAPTMSLVEFEAMVFALSVLCLTVTYVLTREAWPGFWAGPPAPPPSPTYSYAGVPTSAGWVTSAPPASAPPVERARCASCGAVFEAPWSPLLPHMGPRVLRKCPACGRRSFMEQGIDAPLSWPPPEQRRS